ncbi:hypothetical protein JX580_08135 [Thiomicrospira microaerophila]|uniref:hypothetical protein n=1 Tax=Thiomicrospira microaerophila TaxID=406020 RepID=UPI0020109B40|nr:hypothetical protein [Thiomicrospira microaerophila]UQB41641.1 hypothetical protein JX580_08135 [Thiomicrospira microaerophila]
MKRQNGSILMLMMLILVVGGATVMYSLLNQSPEKLRLGQSEKQSVQIDLLKNRLILFANHIDLFCNNSALTSEPTARYLPLADPASFSEMPLAFGDLINIENIVYEVEDYNQSTLVFEETKCNDSDTNNNLFNFCLIDSTDPANNPNYAIHLNWINSESMPIKIFRTEICP